MLSTIGHLYDAANPATISTVLEEIRRDILDYLISIEDGQIVDPMSQYVDLVLPDAQESLKPYTSTAIEVGTMTNVRTLIPETRTDYPAYTRNIQGGWDSEQNRFFFTNVNLGTANGLQRHGFRFSYQVRLKEAYRDGRFYPTNGPTYVHGRTFTSSLGFAIPSVRSATLDIPVEKVWAGDAAYPELRKEIELQLQQRIGTTGNWTDVTDKKIVIAKEATGDALKGTFTKLPIEQITKNNQTFVYVPIQYRVVEKVGANTRVYGYSTPQITPTAPIDKTTDHPKVTITNSLLTTTLSFTKVREDGEQLQNAGFSLYRGTSETPIQVINHPADSRFTFEDLPVGDYVLKETQTPVGFQKHEDIAFKIIDDAGTLKINDFPDELTTIEGIQIKNHLDPFDLSILKLDEQTKKPLDGVVFSLTEKNSSTVLATATTMASNGIGQFKAGQTVFVPTIGQTYVITETTNKTGYAPLESTFEVTIQADGSVRINSQGERFTNFTTEDNHIQLTVTNVPKGMLPSTGGPGKKMYSLSAMALLVLIGLIGSYYVYRSRKEEHNDETM